MSGIVVNHFKAGDLHFPVKCDRNGNITGVNIRTDPFTIGKDAQSTASKAHVVGDGITNANANTIKYGSNGVTHFQSTAKVAAQQTISNGTNVVCNAWAGKVTMFSNMAVNTDDFFIVENSYVTTSSIVLVSLCRNGTTPVDNTVDCTCEIVFIDNGMFRVHVTCPATATGTYSGPISLNFIVI